MNKLSANRLSRLAAAASQQMKEKEYWLRKLSGCSFKTAFPYDFKQPFTASDRDSRETFALPDKSAEQLLHLSKNSDYTLHLYLVTVQMLLLYKYTDNCDIILGTPIYKQSNEGDFTNTLLPLRCSIDPAGTPKDFLKQVARVMTEALENQGYPIEILVEQLQLDDSAGDFPLLDVVILLENIQDQQVVNHINNRLTTAFLRSGKDIRATINFSSSWYHPGTVQRIACHLKQLLENILFDMDRSISEISVLSPEERELLLYGFNRSTRDHGVQKTLHQLFEEQVSRAPDNIAVIDGDTELRYSELNRQANRLAVSLREAGGGPDVIVGLVTERSVETIIGIFAILKAGGAYLPLDPDYPEIRLKSMLEDTCVSIVIASRRVLDKYALTHFFETFRTIPGKILLTLAMISPAPPISEVYLQESANPGHINQPDNLAYIIFTSGSTGIPKGIMTTHRNIIRVVKETKYINITPEDRLLQLSPLSFDGSVFDIFGALLNGAALVLLKNTDVFDVNRLAELIEFHGITIFFTTTALFNTLVKIGPHHLKQVKKILFGGERSSVEHTRSAVEALGKDRIIHVYGPTETTVYATYYPVAEITENCITIPIGNALSGTSVYLLDSYRQPVPIGVAGELYIGAAGVARGYMNRPDLTANAFMKSPFQEGERLYRSGDIVRRNSSGAIEYIGRVDQQVKIRGFRIEPGEIENRLLSHEIVEQAVVAVREEEGGEKYLCAYVTLSSRQKPAAAITLLKQYLSRQLPSYMVPSHIIPLIEMPLKPNGKVDQDALPLTSSADLDGFIPPRDDIENLLVEIWANLLKLDRSCISIDADFFQLGGHSLKITILATHINKTFDVHLPLLDIFAHPTIREIGKSIKAAGREMHQDIPAVEKKEYYPLSSAQKRLFFLDRFEDIQTSYNIPSLYNVAGPLDKNRLNSAFLDLMHRHEALRTSFEWVDGQPVQRIHDAVAFQLAEIQVPLNTANPGTINGIINKFIQPFDLSQSPLLRATLVVHQDSRHLLMVDMHHIISDGTSMIILVEECIRLYAQESLPQLNIQYKDFTIWQNQLNNSGEMKKQEDFWLNQFEGQIHFLDLPADYPRPTIQSYEGRNSHFEIDSYLTTRLKVLAVEENTTLFIVLLTLFNVLLARLSGQEDIVVGVPIAGRRHVAVQEVIGMFVNTLAIRNFPTQEKSFRHFLSEVKSQALRAYENQDFQFEELVEKLNVQRDTSRNPVFDVKFILQNMDSSTVEIPGLTFTSFPVENTSSKFDLSFDGYEIEDRLFFTVEYCSRLFNQETIERFIRYFQQIIHHTFDCPTAKISGIQLMTEEDRQQILHEFNADPVPFPSEETIHRLFQKQAEIAPDQVAVFFADRWFCYRQLQSDAMQLAYYLMQRENIMVNDCVGVMMERSIYLPAAILGTLMAGAIYVPIDPLLPEERIRHIVNDTGMRVILSQEKFIRSLNQLLWGCQPLQAVLCIDSHNITSVEEQPGQLMSRKLWDYVGETSENDITGGGWLTSYTGKPFKSEEMEEYGDNVLLKLTPLLNSDIRVLEIGSASGLTMYRIAPRVGFYMGTDFSSVIIEKNKEKVTREGWKNICLSCVPAHQIDQLNEKEFDLIIINSVVHCFPGHNYLSSVIRKSITLLKDQGNIFIGDVMDARLKQELIREMLDFKQANRGSAYRTKTDWSNELFVAPQFFENLTTMIPVVRDVRVDRKIYTIENELTKFRYDVLLSIDKSSPFSNENRERLRKSLCDRTDLDQVVFRPPLPLVSPGALAYIIYTSGSTGIPKGVMVAHRSTVNRIHWMQKAYPIGRGDVILQKTPIIFDVSIWELFWWSINGASLYLLEPGGEKDPETIARDIQKYKVTTIHFVPSLLSAFLEYLDATGETVQLKTIRQVFASGESLKPHQVEEFYRLFGTAGSSAELVNLYGPTEATVDVSYFNCPREKKLGIVPIGKPIDNIALLILDHTLKLSPVGVPGQLCIGGAGLARGYLNQPQLTAEKFIVNGEHIPVCRQHTVLYTTGDHARWLPDGNIQFLGRIDQQVKIRGFRIEPGEIERAIRTYPGIKESVVMIFDRRSPGGRDSDSFLTAYITNKTGPFPAIEDLQEHLSTELPQYMIPTYFIFLDQLPLTSTGKLDRGKLPPPYLELTPDSLEAPTNPVEKKLVELWSGILMLPQESIGVTSNFFRLGGHSLKAMSLMSRIHKVMNVKVPLAIIFKESTIKALAAYILKSRKNRYAALEPAELKTHYTLSSAQKRMYILQQMEPGSINYNLSQVQQVEGPLKVPQLEFALERLIQRHESLRTSFELVELDPVQKIHPRVPFRLAYFDLEIVDSKDDTWIKSSVESIINRFIKPFDLSAVPLLRAQLVKITQTHHILMIDMHHIISDGISSILIMRELMDLYRGETLPAVNIQYKDYSEWQGSDKEQELVKKQGASWLNLFSGEIPILHLPTDYPRPEVRNFRGAQYHFHLEGKCVEGLKQLAIEEDVTMYMLLLCLMNVLFSKLANQEDIVIGTAVSGRNHPDLNQVVGMFVNTLAMRNYPQKTLGFNLFLQQVRENTLQAFENQDYPFETLVSQLGIKQLTNRHPLFDIGFGLENYETSFIEIPGLTVTPYNNRYDKSKFDISWVGMEKHGRLYFKIEYSSELFSKETIDLYVKNFNASIAAILENKNILLKDIRLSHDLLLAKSEMPLIDIEF